VLFTAPPGSAVTLSLKGSVVAAAADRLSVKVATLTVFPVGLKLLGLRKPMTLALPADALVDGGGRTSDLATVGPLAGRSVTVLTQPARTSLETQSAKGLAFSIARIVLG
jgi:hypothetical protein